MKKINMFLFYFNVLVKKPEKLCLSKILVTILDDLWYY